MKEEYIEKLGIRYKKFCEKDIKILSEKELEEMKLIAKEILEYERTNPNHL